MFSQSVFNDKIINYLDNQFLNKIDKNYENIFDLQDVLYLRKNYLYSSGLTKESNKALYYFAFEEYLDNMLVPFNNDIAKAMHVKQLKVPDYPEQISLQEFEVGLHLKKFKIEKELKLHVSTILNSEINELYEKKWIYLNDFSHKTNNISYLNFYKEYYGQIMEDIYLNKNEILGTIKRKINSHTENSFERGFDLESIIKDIEDTTKQLGLYCHFNEILQNPTQDSFKMYYSYKEQKILLSLKTPKNYTEILKIWHEFGHVVHYQNMDRYLPFEFSKLHNLHNMEGIALFYQFLGNEFYEKSYDFNIYEMMWWTFIEFFSLYEWLDSNMERKFSDIFSKNLQTIYKEIPTYPCPLRYFNKGFKSFRYIVGLYLAFGIKSYLNDNPNESANFLKEILYSGGIHKNQGLILSGIKFALNQ